MSKPFSESCEQNKQVILNIIQHEFQHAQSVLEIGSGTGQHAVFFAEHLPHIRWQTSDQAVYLSGIQAWINDSNCENLPNALALNVTEPWPKNQFDGVFSANTVHIMAWPEVKLLFKGVGEILQDNASFCLYGPFNYNNQYTSPSNENFDAWLKNRDPNSGIRNYEDLLILAEEQAMHLEKDYEMPANNRLLVWVKNS